MYRILSILLLTFAVPGIAQEKQSEKKPTQSIDDLIEEETDLFYWNDQKPSPIDNPTTPGIREDQWFEKTQHPPQTLPPKT